MEKIDFRGITIHELFPKLNLMAIITPTTTMVREGVTQASTKIDAGFNGNLNWALRNSSHKDLILQHGEPMFKLTFFELDEHESPDVEYGARESDTYQGTEGIQRSSRRIPADIPKSKIISSSLEKLDHKQALREAGYPLTHIGTELTELHGRFEVVSADVRLMGDRFQKQAEELAEKIETETNTFSGKIEETRERVLEKFDVLFDRKFIRTGGFIIGVIPLLYAGVTFLQGNTSLSANVISFIAIVLGLVIFGLSYVLSRPSNRAKK